MSAATTSYVLTAIGDDRAGLVSALAEVVASHGGNWERSRMSELAGKFAGIVQVSVPTERGDEFVAALEPLTGLLDVAAHVGRAGEPPTVQWALDLVGTDRPGIVREVSAVLAAHGVGIDDLDTQTRDAPMAGGVLFEATAVLDVPAGVDHEALRAALEAVANELMVELAVLTGAECAGEPGSS